MTISPVLCAKEYRQNIVRQFAYDELNQLVRSAPVAKISTKVYNYNRNCARTGKLTAYGSMAITYDAIGNPLSYRGYTLTWQNGRQLASMRFGTVNIGFTYDVDGLRTSKTIPNIDLEHKYYYVGNRLQYETIGDSSALWYFYDADGNPSGIRYKNGSTTNDYYFVCNWRGDVIQIYNASGVLVATYDYDAWGKVSENATSADTQNITETNPIRYRGYYYDTETGLYYLKSRYYDPTVKRFLNADGYVQTGDGLHDKNMFAYCLNNSVNLSDPTGRFPWVVIGILVLFGVGGAVGGILGYKSNEKLINKPKTKQGGSNYNKPNSSNNNPKTKTNNSNKSNSHNQNSGSASYNAETPELTSKDRAMNAYIGATLGIAVAGAVVALIGSGLAIGEVVIMGVTGARISAIGCLAFNAVAIIFAPFYGVELEPIDWDYGY